MSGFDDAYENTRFVFIEKSPFKVEILPNNSCRWYDGMDEEILLVRTGLKRDIEIRSSILKPILVSGFYVVLDGRFTDMVIPKKDAIKVKNK